MNPRSQRSFTLIELLTVVVIIAILVALLFPAIQSIIKKGESSEAKTEIKVIENAIRLFYTEYGILPVDCSGGTADIAVSTTNSDILKTLMVNNGTFNPRGIAFLVPPSRKNGFDPSTYYLTDPWGGGYTIILDCNYDGTISGQTGVNAKHNGQSGPVVIFSYGPDRTPTNSDDVTNYQ